MDPVQAPLASFGAMGIARLAPGNMPESAYAELQGLISRLSELFPDSDANQPSWKKWGFGPASSP